MSGIVLPRRKFLLGLAGLVAAPAIVRASSLMPVRVWAAPWVLRIADPYNPEAEIARLGELSHPNMTLAQAEALFDASIRKGLNAHLITSEYEHVAWGGRRFIPPQRSLCA